MNSFWNKNLNLFVDRFPELCKNLSITRDTKEPLTSCYEVLPSKSGSLTAKENNIFIHSAYNPEKEAESLIKNCKQENQIGAIFLSCGLGYAPVEYSKAFPTDTIFIIEPDIEYFFAFLKYIDLEELFSHKKLVIALKIDFQVILNIIETCGGIKKFAILENKAQTNHNQEFFSELKLSFKKNKDKDRINNSTLEKFSKLWQKNCCKNITQISTHYGINIFQNKCPQNLPVVILAAGPTLSAVLPYLQEIKKRALLIATDTVLRICLKHNIEPDFIILVDPQYYAYRHIAGLKSNSSILITDPSSYPSVFNFCCKKIVLCSSIFPLCRYFESKLEIKGELSAGGSVATTAWDFARFIGAKQIFCAGLDLGYPKSETHIKGSLFEEKSHTISNKLSSAEKLLTQSLFHANTIIDKDYSGNQIKTDDKMKMFAWWFENKAIQYPDIKTFSFSDKSLYIPGINVTTIENFLAKDTIEHSKNVFFENAEKNKPIYDSELFSQVLKNLLDGIEQISILAKKGISLADKGLTSSNININKILEELNFIDEKILKSDFKDIAAIVFPTENQLNKIFSNTIFPDDKTKELLLKTKIIYKELLNSIKLYKKYLSKN
ncbi:MAG: motility associated factor glycosyltransferase family protein [Treponema sp.]|nr:motility associated factor glycosyltransferase family protein [Treponema sp.]MBP3607488.1 motility associated factor glycosyltransferase family protein [Treponema sp.]